MQIEKLKAIYDNLCSTKGIELDSERAKTLEKNFFNTYGKNLRTEVFDKFFCDVYAIIQNTKKPPFHWDSIPLLSYSQEKNNLCRGHYFGDPFTFFYISVRVFIKQ